MGRRVLTESQKKLQLAKLGRQYETAKAKGDKAGMQAAHAEANKLRASEPNWYYDKKTGQTVEKKSAVAKTGTVVNLTEKKKATKPQVSAATMQTVRSLTGTKQIRQTLDAKAAKAQVQQKAVAKAQQKAAEQAKKQKRTAALNAEIAKKAQMQGKQTGMAPRQIAQLPTVRDVLRSTIMTTPEREKQKAAAKWDAYQRSQNMSRADQALRAAVLGTKGSIQALGETAAASLGNSAKMMGQKGYFTRNMNDVADEFRKSDAYQETINQHGAAARTMTEAANRREKATEGLNPTEKFLMDAGISIAQNVPGMALSVVNPALGGAFMGATAAGSRAYELQQQGESAQEAFTRGLVSGGIEALTERFSVDSFLKTFHGTGAKTALKNVLRQMGVEASEEGASYIMNYVADKAAKDKNATYSWSELAAQMGGGAISGGVFGGLGAVANRLGASGVQNQQSRTETAQRSGRMPGQVSPATRNALDAANTQALGQVQTPQTPVRAVQQAEEGAQPGTIRQGTWQEGEVKPRLRPEYEERAESTYRSAEEEDLLQRQVAEIEAKTEPGAFMEPGSRAFAPDRVNAENKLDAQTDRIGDIVRSFDGIWDAERHAQELEDTLPLTERDRSYVEAALMTGSTSNLYECDNPQDALYLFQVKQEAKDARRPFTEWVAERKDDLQMRAAEAAELFADVRVADKKTGLQYSRETMERNIYDIFRKADPKSAQTIIDQYFKPVHAAVAEGNRLKTKMRKRVAELGLNAHESAVVQYLLEDQQGAASQYAAEHNGKIDSAKCQTAVKAFRQIYQELYDDVSRALVRNGYEPAHFRQNYAPHFMEHRANSFIGRVAQSIGLYEPGLDMLPTDLAGITDQFRPGKKWFGNLLQRNGNQTVYDAVKGFDQYIETAADVIYLTDSIQELRALEDALRYRFSNDTTRAQIDAINEQRGMNPIERRQQIEDIYKKTRNGLGNFVTNLRRYTDNIAGKKDRADRGWEDDFGRQIYQLSKNLEGRVAANMVGLNPGSWLTNFIPITQAWGENSSLDLLQGMKDTVKSYVKSDGFRENDDFLTNRIGSESITKTPVQKASSLAGKPMEWIDQFTAETIVRARLAHNIRSSGMDYMTAWQEADDYTASLMADRSKGAQPTLFNRKGPVSKAFTMFQLEVNNQISMMFKDIPRRLGEDGALAVGGALTKIFVGAFLYNMAYSALTGRDSAFDPIGAIVDAFGIGDDDEEPKSAIEVAGSLKDSVLDQTPFIGGLMGGGRIPISSAIPNVTNLAKLADGEVAPEKKREIAEKELSKPLYYLLPPFGGGAIKKGVESAKVIREGGSYTYKNDGERYLKYPFDKKNNTMDVLRAVLFGQYATEGGKKYVESDFDGLNVNETKAYDALVASGVGNQEAFDTVRRISAIEAVKDEDGKTVESAKQRQRDALFADSALDAKQKRAIDIAMINGGEIDGAAFYDDEDAYLLSTRFSLRSSAQTAANIALSDYGVPVSKYLQYSDQLKYLKKDDEASSAVDKSVVFNEIRADATLNQTQKDGLYRKLILEDSDGRERKWRLYFENLKNEDGTNKVPLEDYTEAVLMYSRFGEQYEDYRGDEDKKAMAATDFSHYLDSKGYPEDVRELVEDQFKYFGFRPVNPIPYNFDMLSNKGEIENRDRVEALGIPFETYLAIKRMKNEKNADGTYVYKKAEIESHMYSLGMTAAQVQAVGSMFGWKASSKSSSGAKKSGKSSSGGSGKSKSASKSSSKSKTSFGTLRTLRTITGL